MTRAHQPAASFPRVERLPEIPGVPKYTSTGYAINGKHVRTVPHVSAMRPASPSLLGRVRGWIGR